MKTEVIARHTPFSVSARVAPECGANLISLKLDGSEFIYWDEAGFLADGAFTGAFNMFPTPCRLADCSYEFEGGKVIQRKRGKDVFIHGLIRDEAMECRNEGAKITSTLEITPSHPIFEGFPFKCSFSVIHELHATGLTVAFKAQNNDSCNIPFAYGIHPFWRIHGRRKDVWLKIPCDNILELENLVPTGRYSPVDGTDFDLRELKSIENLFIDNVFWKREAGESAEIVFKAIGKKIIIEASAVFQHVIVYAPEGKPFVCVENLTSSPNAQNLAAAGKNDVAGLLIAAPGKSVEGWIRYSMVDG